MRFQIITLLLLLLLLLLRLRAAWHLDQALWR
jgi:hypothetical protein